MAVESNRIEYKRQLTDTLEKEVIAFLNYRDGGVIYLGVDDTGNACGLEEVDAVQLKVKDRIRNNIRPSTMGLFDVIVESRDDQEIIKITVASGSEKPYYLKSKGMTARGCFMRIGSASEPMIKRQIEELFSRRVRNSIGTIKSRKKNLTFEQLKIYYSGTPLKLNDKFAHNLELLTEEGELNYAAYLLSDENGNSIKVAKYAGLDRIKLIENEEYGYCSLVKATKAVLEKLKIENKTFAKITYEKRLERKLLAPAAIHEAVINAIIHNDYSNEVPPKFEFFADRLEITSAGGIPQGLSEEDFFMGYSVPQNKELMRVFRDLEMVEQLGSGIPRILAYYPKSIYHFSANFIRLVLPFAEGFEALTAQATGQDEDSINKGLSDYEEATAQATAQVDMLILFCSESRPMKEMMDHLDLSHRTNFRDNILKPLLESGRLQRTLPDTPSSPKQRYIASK